MDRMMTAVAGLLLTTRALASETVETRHGDIHEDEVRMELLDEVDDLVPVVGLADHLDPRDAGEERANARADEGMVVGQHHSERRDRFTFDDFVGGGGGGDHWTPSAAS